MKIRCMQFAVREAAKTTPLTFIHIRCDDLLSIPQLNKPGKSLAVASLPAFAMFADLSVVCSPDARHRKTGKQCVLA